MEETLRDRFAYNAPLAPPDQSSTGPAYTPLPEFQPADQTEADYWKAWNGGQTKGIPAETITKFQDFKAACDALDAMNRQSALAFAARRHAEWAYLFADAMIAVRG